MYFDLMLFHHTFCVDVVFNFVIESRTNLLIHLQLIPEVILLVEYSHIIIPNNYIYKYKYSNGSVSTKRQLIRA